jgi:hypothetical protein
LILGGSGRFAYAYQIRPRISFPRHRVERAAEERAPAAAADHLGYLLNRCGTTGIGRRLNRRVTIDPRRNRRRVRHAASLLPCSCGRRSGTGGIQCGAPVSVAGWMIDGR